MVVAPPSREQLSADARWVLSVVGCGSEIGQPEFRQAVVRVWNAGPEIVPVLAELVPRGDFALVCNAARIGTDHPPSVELRAALRARRDAIGLEQAPYSWVGYLLVYFARFGDETDLAWMEKAVGGLREKDRPRGEEHLRQLRARLAPN
ncbi:MAG: hypothetical protein C0501_27255 [Isosphaera sp.]|nr:hypothetical protein [Isosphaera sp.]